MTEQLEGILQQAQQSLVSVEQESDLQAWRIQYLGRASALSQVLDGLKELPREQRPAVGKRANEVKTALETAFAARQAELQAVLLERALERDRVDISLPGRKIPLGRLHPATQTLLEICAIWRDMGFQVYRSRDVETDA